jgi:HK97 family phage prohead protease
MAQRASETTVNLPSLITREATFLPETVNEDDRTVDLVWTTGSRVLRGFWERYWEELSLDPKHVRMKRINNGAPLLKNHYGDVESVLGVVEEAALEAKRGRGKVRFAKAEDDPEADKVFRKVKDGILQNISVGYQVFKMEKVEDGADKIPVYRAVDWEPYELSVVAMGADDGAGFRSQSKTTIPCVFVTQRAVNFQKETKMADNEETPTPAQESPAVAITRQANQSRVENARQIAEAQEVAAQQALAAERARIAGIRSLAKRTKLGTEWADKLIEAGVTIEAARAAAIDGIVDEPDDIDANTGLRVSAGDDARDKFVRSASAWLLEHCGKRSLVEQAEKKSPTLAKVDFAAGNQFRGMSPFELARESLERAGVKTRGMNRMELIGRAFVHRGAMQTTSDFSTMLEVALHKILLGAYETQETTWERFCGTDEVADFRSANRYRTGSLPSLPLVAEHAEYTNGVIPDASKYAISTERHGEIFSLSREVIINDDMGALANLASEFGRAAARTIENAVYALLALNSGLGPTQSDSQPFFHANRANVNATGSTLTVAGLDADRVVMRAQKDPSNRDYLSLSPAVLVLSDALYGTALVINDAQYDPDTANKLQRPNMVRGLFKDIVGTPRLSASTTRRYLFADPAQSAAIVVAFLQGYGRGPIMESRDGWRVDGVEWKVTQYAKAQMGDPKGAVTNAGT